MLCAIAGTRTTRATIDLRKMLRETVDKRIDVCGDADHVESLFEALLCLLAIET